MCVHTMHVLILNRWLELYLQSYINLLKRQLRQPNYSLRDQKRVKLLTLLTFDWRAQCKLHALMNQN